MLPSSVLAWKTPYEVLFGKTPDYSHMRVLGCLCYSAQKVGDKFESRARKCVFLGYPFGQKGYKLYDLATNKVILSRDVVFCETVFSFKVNKPIDVVRSLPLVNPALDDFQPPFEFSSYSYPSCSVDSTT